MIDDIFYVLGLYGLAVSFLLIAAGICMLWDALETLAKWLKKGNDVPGPADHHSDSLH